MDYRIYSNKRRGAHLIFRATSAALIRGRRLFNIVPDIFTFLYFYSTVHSLLIFLWTDTKLVLNLEFREKLTL